jgi:hypothetical protein
VPGSERQGTIIAIRKTFATSAAALVGNPPANAAPKASANTLDGVMIDQVLGATNYRSLREDEAPMA